MEHQDHPRRRASGNFSKAEALHKLICGFCFEASNQREADDWYKRIDRFLVETMHVQEGHPLLAVSVNNCSHLSDALHFSYENKKDTKRDPKWRDEQAERLLMRLRRGFQEAIDVKAVTLRQYANILILPNKDGYTPLHEAILTGNPALYKIFRDELRKLQRLKTLSGEEYARQFTLETRFGHGLLEMAGKTGNSVLYQAVAADSDAVSRRSASR